MLDLAEDGRRLHVWAKTKSDTEAAAVMKTTKVGWIRWRKSRGLPSKAVYKAADYLAAWRKSRSDQEAAAALDTDADKFKAWRRSNQLPPCLGNQDVRHDSRRAGLKDPPGRHI